ncbi:MAG: tetratricopeptide repeat protein [Candidatus Hydrogenedentota bacterium]
MRSAHWAGPGGLVLLTLILVAAACVRALFTAELVHSADFDAPILDPQLNDYWARALVTGDWEPPPYAADPQIRTTPYGRPPGYPYLLAATYRVFGPGYLAPRIVQMALGVVNLLLIYLLARRLFGLGAALAAAAIGAVYWPFPFFEGELNSSAFEVLGLLLFTIALLRLDKRGGVLMALSAGLLLGFLALLRPHILLLLPLTVLWLGMAAHRQGEAWPVAGVHAVAFVLACAALVGPAVARNHQVSGDFFLVSCYGGVNAYIGNNADATGHAPPVIPDLLPLTGMNSWNCFNYPDLVDRLGRTMGRPHMDFADTSHFFYNRAVGFIVRRPADALALTLRKTLLFWGPAVISDSKVVAHARADSRVLRWLPGFPLAAGLSLAGLLLLAWRRVRRHEALPPGTGLVLLVIAGYFVSVLPFFTAERYRHPIAPFLLILAGAYTAALCASVRARQPARALLLLTLGGAACALTHAPWIPYTPNKATWHLHQGIAHRSAGRIEAAKRAFEAALAIDETHAEAHVQIGFVLDNAREPAAARTHYARAVDANHQHVVARNNLGHALARNGDAAGAENHYRAALALDPYNVRAMDNLAALLSEQGQHEEALELRARRVALTPEDAQGHVRYVRALLRAGRKDTALEALERALDAAPATANTHILLGDLYAAANKPRRARRHYEKALELAPDSPRAQHGITRLDAEPTD